MTELEVGPFVRAVRDAGLAIDVQPLPGRTRVLVYRWPPPPPTEPTFGSTIVAYVEADAWLDAMRAARAQCRNEGIAL